MPSRSRVSATWSTAAICAVKNARAPSGPQRSHDLRSRQPGAAKAGEAAVAARCAPAGPGGVEHGRADPVARPGAAPLQAGVACADDRHLGGRRPLERRRRRCRGGALPEVSGIGRGPIGRCRIETSHLGPLAADGCGGVATEMAAAQAPGSAARRIVLDDHLVAPEVARWRKRRVAGAARRGACRCARCGAASGPGRPAGRRRPPGCRARRSTMSRGRAKASRTAR